MTVVELGIIQDILETVSKQDNECLYAGIHFTNARKYVKLLSTEENWLPIIWPSTAGWWREITIEEAILASYPYINLWMVIKWSHKPTVSHSKQINMWLMPLRDNTYIHRYSI